MIPKSARTACTVALGSIMLNCVIEKNIECHFEPIDQLGADQAVAYMYVTQEDARNGAKNIRIYANQALVTGLLV